MKHAKLSASGSSRWLNCTGSIHAESLIPTIIGRNAAADYGTCAHELADIILKTGDTLIATTTDGYLVSGSSHYDANGFYSDNGTTYYGQPVYDLFQDQCRNWQVPVSRQHSGKWCHQIHPDSSAA